VTGDPQKAQDLLQTALERTYRRRARVRRSELPEAYVRRMIVNAATDAWRAGRGRRTVGFDEVHIAPLPDAAVDGLIARQALLARVRELPVGQRAVLVLRYFDDLTEAETAHVLGCSVGTACQGDRTAAAAAAGREARMSTEIEAALRAAFEEAGQEVTPGPDLAGRVRAGTRRRCATGRFPGGRVASHWLREVDGVAIGIGDMRHSLSPGHIVRLTAYAPAQGLHPLKHAVDIFDRDTEEDPARGTGSALSVGDEAHFRVTDAQAHEEGRAAVWHAKCLCGSEQPGIEGQETV
jgi:RNA polymerase sigma factor (sigma-70 family)